MNPDSDPNNIQPTPPQVDPNTFFQPVATVPQPAPVAQVTQADTLPAPAPKKKILIITGVVLVVFLIAIVVVALVAGSGQKANKANTKTDTSQVESPVAATSNSVQQGDDAISQYLSGLDDNKDFPAKALDATTLGLQ